MKIKKILAAVVVFILSTWPLGSIPLAQAATLFSDVPSTSTYADSIEYLVTVGIIKGYEDNTFRPDQNVNRAEFLKIALESSGIVSDVAMPTGFSDVDESAWYAKYIRKAKQAGWIQGYSDGTFKPEQSVNKVEALKMVSEIQGWDIPEQVGTVPYLDTPRLAWYTRYVEYAKSKNFLEEVGTNFIPDAFYSRSKVSEVLFRTYITEKSGEDVYSEDLIEKYPADAPSPPTPSAPSETQETAEPAPSANEPVMPEPEALDFKSVNFEMYDFNFFSAVNLKTGFPSIFYDNEIYYFEGAVNSQVKKAFVFMAPEGAGSEKYTTYIAEVVNGNVSIPVIFREPGNYTIGLIAGESGQSKVASISVLPQLPKAALPPSATSPSSAAISYGDYKTSISWKNNGYDFIRLTLFQGSDTEVFYHRQGKEKINIDYQDFSEFSQGTVNLYVQGADLKSAFPLEINIDWSNPIKKSFTATKHQYSYRGNELSLTTIPETLSSKKTITVTGKTNADIFAEGAIVKPNGFVDTVDLQTSTPLGEYYGSKIIKAGSNFTLTYEPATTGTYLIEINDKGGTAVLNSPVYIANGIPLLPDFFDLNSGTEPEDNFNLSSARSELLALINQERKKVGLSAVILDNELNNLAQLHSKDMVTRDFFGHINPDGETPDDRRIELGIATAVGENLAIAPTVEYTHYGLMQSAIHRKNILDSTWTKVGIGIVQNDKGSLVTTQEFSANPLTEADLSAMKNSLLQEMNDKRFTLGIGQLSVDTNVENAAEAWSDKMADQQFFSFTAPNGETLTSVAQEYAPGKNLQAIILESSSKEKITDESIQTEEVAESQWGKIGIGLAVDPLGIIKATLLFTMD